MHVEEPLKMLMSTWADWVESNVYPKKLVSFYAATLLVISDTGPGTLFGVEP